MRRILIAVSIVCLVLAASGSVPAAAQPVPIGAQLEVNTFTTGTQTDPAVGMAQNGSFVVSWRSVGQDGDLSGIVARKFQSDGTPFSEFVVNQTTAGQQRDGRISVNPSGDFAVIWLGHVDGNLDAHRRSVTSNGTQLLNEAQVNLDSVPNVAAADICVAADDRAVAVWDAGPIRFRLFDAAGAPTSGEEGVAPAGANSPSVACAADRSFVVAHEAGDEDATGIIVSRFNPDGVGLQLFTANEDQTGSQVLPEVSASADGRFVVAWQEGAERAEARLFDSDGTPLTADLELFDADPGDSVFSVDVAMASDGAFVASWVASLSGTGTVQAAEFDRTGHEVPGRIEIEDFGVVAARGAIGPQTFVLIWDSGADIAGQRFVRRSIFADRFESADVEGWTSSVP